MKIVGFAGKKQSGKNTAFNFMLGVYMTHLGLVRKCATVSDDGKLFITDLWGDDDYAGELDITRNNTSMNEFRENYVYPYIKIYSFADLLKQNVCIDVLGLTHEQCFGTDEDKNSLTELRWENMPEVTTRADVLGVMIKRYTKDMCEEFDINEVARGLCSQLRLTCHKPGKMTAREVMQFVGTNIFRKMYGNVWVDATIRKIQEEKSELAVITDCRFPNEVEGIQKAGGKVIRFTRQPFEDQHESETALDEDKFSKSNFDAILDNKDMSVKEQNAALYRILFGWGYIPKLS